MSRHRLAAALVIAIAIVPRVAHIRSLALENDEIAEATWSSLPFSAMMANVRNDAVHPPGDYLIQFVVGRLGPEWVRRIPSIVAGVATVAVVIALGTLWVTPAAGLASGLILALSPVHIAYSQNVRPYSLAMFFVAASLLALEKRRIIWWSVLVFLAGGTLYFAGAVAALAGVIRVPWRKFAMHALAWTLLYSPWFPVLRHAAGISSPVPRDRLNWDWWRWRLETLGAGNERILGAPVSLGSWAFWLFVAAGLAASVGWRPLRLATFTLLAGSALIVAFLQVHPHYPIVRYLLPPWIAAAPLAGAGVYALMRFRFAQPVAIAALLLFAGHSILKIDEYRRGHSDWRSVAAFVHDRIRPNETLVVTNGWVTRNFGYYWKPVSGIWSERYAPDGRDLIGPAWIVTGGCLPSAANTAPLMLRAAQTEWAEVRYLRAGQRMKRVEICPE
jgi:MFS family permease